MKELRGGRTLSIRLDGPEVTLRQARQAFDALADLAREVGGELLTGHPDRVRWVLSGVQKGSFSFEFVAEPATMELPAERVQEVVRSIVRGVAAVQRNAVRPPHFTDGALRSAKELVDVIGESVSSVTITGGEQEAVGLTKQLSVNVEEIIGARLESFGTVEGYLEAISVHRKRQFYIYDLLTGRGVECFFGDRLPLDYVLSAFTKRVAARGLIRSRRTGEPVSIEVAEMTIMPGEDELPPADKVKGILAGK